MELAELAAWQWLVVAVAALLCGCAKTGLPGLGILVVPLMAMALRGKPSVGTLLPLLIVADCFAVFWYRRHADWDKLLRLVPWLLPGMALGVWVLGSISTWHLAGLAGDALFEVCLGLLVLSMLILVLLQRRYRDRLTPRQRGSVALTGGATGLATTVGNAAGPIMTLYLAGMGLPKERFMGTNAWFFLLINLVKVPLYVLVGLWRPQEPLFTAQSLLLDCCLLPLVLIGCCTGRWLFGRLPQRVFDGLVLGLAGLAALHLCLGPWIRSLLG